MSQLALKGVYYDSESEGLWFLNNSGSYEEITVGVTIYTGDGSLSGDREIDLDGHELTFKNGVTDILELNPGVRVYMVCDDGNGVNTGLDLHSVLGDEVAFNLQANTGSNLVNIYGDGILDSLTYTADTHTFNGDVGVINLGGNGSGFAAVDDNGVLSWTAGDPANTIYDADGSLSNDRTVDLNGHELIFGTEGGTLIEVSEEEGSEYVQMTAYNATGGGNRADYEGAVSPTQANIVIFARFNDGDKFAGISGQADVSTGALTYTADTHTFNGNFKSGTEIDWDLDGHQLYIYDEAQRAAFKIDPTAGNEEIDIYVTDLTGDGNITNINAVTTDLRAAFDLRSDFNDGEKRARIQGVSQSGSATIDYTADTHTFNVGMTITELAGVGTRAIAVDTNGKIVLL